MARDLKDAFNPAMRRGRTGLKRRERRVGRWPGGPMALTLLGMFVGSPTLKAAANELVAWPEAGLRLQAGFQVSEYASQDLADDIYAMTLDAKGRPVVTSRGYIKTLEDTDGDGRADESKLFAAT